MNSSPLLTILIPTRNRSKNLDNSLRRIVNSAKRCELLLEKVGFEVVVADNFSIDNTKEIVDKWSKKYNFISYKKHTESRESAESSLFNAVSFANGKYIWSIGDDDFIHLDAIETVINFISESEVSFLLLNCDILNPEGNVVQYMRSNRDFIEYENGLELFNDLGLISPTTTISCLVFKKSEINSELFLKTSSISTIYSHSIFLFISFFNKKSAFLVKTVVTYRVNRVEDEARNIYGVARKSNNLEFFSFTTGLLNLIRFASSETGISVSDILNFQEVEISKHNWNVKHSILMCFILRMFVDQFKILAKKRYFYRLIYKSKIKHLLSEFRNLTESMSDKTSIKEMIASSKNIPLKIFKIRLKKKKIKNILDTILQNVDSLERHLLDIMFSNISKSDSDSCFLLVKSNMALKKLSGFSKKLNIDKQNKILTILIPTYQRPMEIVKSIIRLKDSKIDKIEDVEILFAVNHREGEDISSKIINNFIDEDTNIKIKTFTDFASTAEENINRSIPFCSGEYIFTLGDDDIINLIPFLFMLSLVRQKNADAFVFNSNTEASHYLTDNGQSPNFDNLITNSKSFVNVLRKYGVTDSMAFISRYVIKKSLFKDMSKYIEISKVYSHIFAFAEFLHKKNIKLVSLPISTRIDSVVGVRFAELSNLDNKNSFYYWTSGLISHIKNLINLGIINYKWFYLVRESVNKNLEFLLWRDIFKFFCFQSMKYLKDKNISEQFSEKDLRDLESLDSSVLLEKHQKYITEIISTLHEIRFVKLDELSEQDSLAYNTKLNNLIAKILS